MGKRRVTRTNNRKKKELIPCFVISPIGKPYSKIRKHADAVFEYIVSPSAEEAGFDAKRLDQQDESVGRGLWHEVVQSLSKVPLCIADLTGLNANVMWEVGVRHAWDLPILHLAQEGTRLPFDLFDRHTIFYSLDDRGIAIRSLTRALKSLKRTHLKSEVEWHPPFMSTFTKVMERLAGRYALDEVFSGKQATVRIIREQMQRIGEELEEDTERGDIGTEALPKHVKTIEREIRLYRGSIHAFACIKDGKSAAEDICRRYCGDLLQQMRDVLKMMEKLILLLKKADAAEEDFVKAKRQIDTIVAACKQIEIRCSRQW